jgi:hypothetical protein
MCAGGASLSRTSTAKGALAAIGVLITGLGTALRYGIQDLLLGRH